MAIDRKQLIQELKDRKISDWPYPLVHNLYLARVNATWVEVDEEIYDDQCGCVPPERMGWYQNRLHAFAVGEPARHESDGEPVHTMFVQVGCHKTGYRFFCKDDRLENFMPSVYHLEVTIQYKII